MLKSLFGIAVIVGSFAAVSNAEARAQDPCTGAVQLYNTNGYKCTNVGYTMEFGSNTWNCSGGGTSWVLYSAGPTTCLSGTYPKAN